VAGLGVGDRAAGELRQGGSWWVPLSMTGRPLKGARTRYRDTSRRQPYIGLAALHPDANALDLNVGGVQLFATVYRRGGVTQVD